MTGKFLKIGGLSLGLLALLAGSYLSVTSREALAESMFYGVSRIREVESLEQSLARGEKVRPLHFRDGDFWHEFSDEFNAVANRIEILARKVDNAPAATTDPEETDLLETACPSAK